jgi:hypothetical protein
MNTLLGLWFFLVVAVVVYGLALRQPMVAKALWVALFVRILAAVTHAYVFHLPGDADAGMFEQQAWTWAQDGAIGALRHFRGPHTFFYSVKLAVMYGLLGRSAIMAQALSVLAGVLSVFCAWLLGRELWGAYAGRKVAWCVALFPMSVVFSVFTMRESFFALFVTAGLYWAVRWRGDRRRIAHAGLAMLCFVLGVFYHGGMAVCALVFSVYLMRYLWGHCCRAYQDRRVPVRDAALLGAAVVLLTAFLSGGVTLPKIGRAGNMLDADRIIRAMTSRTKDAAAYPRWTVPRDSLDLVWNVPVRLAYFAWSPFPWDIRSRAHWIGFADSLFYWGLLAALLANRKALMRSPKARLLFLIVFPLMLAFALGTGNFGTAIRHRAKFAAVWIALVAPAIPVVRWCHDGVVLVPLAK